MSAHCTLIIEFDDFDLSTVGDIVAAAQPDATSIDTDDDVIAEAAAPADPAVAVPVDVTAASPS